jgi:hypothetical protein
MSLSIICKDYAELIIREAIHDLSKEEIKRLNAHLERCQKCKLKKEALSIAIEVNK